jgi:hypothetical protein
MTRSQSLRRIHFVNDNGWVHYTSALPEIKGLDMKDYDAVKSIEDCHDGAVQGMFHQLGGEKERALRAMSPDQGRDFLIRMYSEAIEVAAVSPTFLNNVMKNSPLQDYDSWVKMGRGPYQKGRRDRRTNFLLGRINQ